MEIEKENRDAITGMFSWDDPTTLEGGRGLKMGGVVSVAILVGRHLSRDGLKYKVAVGWWGGNGRQAEKMAPDCLHPARARPCKIVMTGRLNRYRNGFCRRQFGVFWCDNH